MIIIDIETTGLEPMTDVISCISFLKDKLIMTFCGENEKEILTYFWNEINDNEEFVGFNISSFDVPFLIKRSLINNVRIRKIGKVTDLRLIANGFFYSYEKKVHGNMDAWSSILGCEPKTEDGKRVVEYYFEKQFDLIKKHCEYDILLTEKLYNRCKNCNLL